MLDITACLDAYCAVLSGFWVYKMHRGTTVVTNSIQRETRRKPVGNERDQQ